MSERYEFVTLTTEAGPLHGLMCGDGEALALHVHGTWGNFYENPFVLRLTKIYNDSDCTYASTNNPGHDGGSIEEDFDASLPVIRGWIELLAPPNSRLVLQGHSLGALKLLRLLAHEEYQDIAERVDRLILLSPFDLVAFYGGSEDRQIANRRSEVARSTQKDPYALVDRRIFDVWPISAGSFLHATEPDGPWDLVPTRNGSAGALRVSVPMLVVLGGNDFASTPSPAAVADIVREQVPAATVHVIQDAPHNFAGKEEELSRQVHSFLVRRD
jgi:alpha-beta hydrolase superfamily lysophospholipase